MLESTHCLPKVSDDDFWLKVYYPDEQYYKWIENNILDDRTFFAVVASFPEIEGWIDTDRQVERTSQNEGKAFDACFWSHQHDLEREGYVVTGFLSSCESIVLSSLFPHCWVVRLLH